MCRLVPVAALLLVTACAGCQHLGSGSEPCPPAATASVTADVKAPQEIHVKAPPDRITVTLPPGYGEAAPAPAPQMGYGPAPSPAPGAYQAAPGAMMTGTTQTVSPPRSRICLTFDCFHIPIPYPKLMALPVEQEVVTRSTYQAAPAYAAAPAPVYAPAPPPIAYAPVYPAPPPPPVYAPVPAPVYAPAPPPPAYAPAAPAECQPDCPPGPLLNHLNMLHNKLDCLKAQLKNCPTGP
jgi:hypothetical protein